MENIKMKKMGLRIKFLWLLTFLPVIAFAADPPGIPDGWSDGYIYANGARIHYYHAVPAPGKPVIVMVHGVTDIGLSWTTLTWKLQDSYDVYMLDARGHGLSDRFTAADDSSTMVKDVVEFVRIMKFEKPILMGHSMGAATVMRIGAEYPELSKAIIMLDPMIRVFTPGQSSGARNPGRTPDPIAMVNQNNAKFEDLVATCHKNTPKWDMIDCQYWALSKKQYHGAYTVQESQAMSGTMRTKDALSKIPVPALILKADATPEVRKANEEAVKNLPRVKLVHIDGAGHNLHHDELQRTVKELNEFLSNFK
jgi:pimeloyl-ACP methyl ester carboxylesterase